MTNQNDDPIVKMGDLIERLSERDREILDCVNDAVKYSNESIGGILDILKQLVERIQEFDEKLAKLELKIIRAENSITDLERVGE